jgi:hypothetical protein
MADGSIKDRRHEICTCPQFVKDATYIVDDDLLIYQASAMVVMKHWCNKGKDRLLEIDIEISKQEVSCFLYILSVTIPFVEGSLGCYRRCITRRLSIC